MKKRILSLLLALCMVFSLLPTFAIAADANPFTDVKASDWYYDEVQYVYSNGLMSGIGDSQFAPNGTTTRGMVVTVLYRLENSPVVNKDCPFSDVKSGSYYEKAITWASTNEIVSGYSSSSFGPDDSITREQMATILYRYANYKGYDVTASADLTGYVDSISISDYAKTAIAWANAVGLVTGTSSTTLAPQGNATRAQIAAVLMRFCENVAEKTYTVTFDLNYAGEGIYQKAKVKSGETVSKPTNPTRSGYSFGGWYTTASANGSAFNFNTAITKDITLYARWTKVTSGGGGGGYVPPTPTPDPDPDPTPDPSVTYYVTFLLNDGSEGAYDVQIVAKYGKASEPTSPERDYYAFDGWYTESSCVNLFDFNTPITEETFLYAGWGSPDGSSGLYAAMSGGGTEYSITGIEVQESQVLVTFNVNSASVLVVNFLDETTKSPIAQLSAQTPDYGELTTISIPLNEELPAHYIVTGDLYDETATKLCDTFTCIEYTSEYEDFSQQTIYDFEGQTVLNFDDDSTTNFGVLNDSVIRIQQNDSENCLSVVDPETITGTPSEDPFEMWYQFDGATSAVAALSAGDVVFAKDTNGQYQLFKIGSIDKTGNAQYLIVPSKDVELTDFYDTLKVDMESEVSEAPEDAEQVSLASETEGGEVQLFADIIDVDTELSASLGGNIKWTPKDWLEISGSLKGTGTIAIEMVYDAKLFKEDYFYCSIITKLDTTIEIEVKAEANNDEKVKEELTLAKVPVPTPIPGLTVYIAQTIPMEWSISGDAKFTFNSKTESGFTYDSYSGKQSVDKKSRTISLDLEAEAKLKFGPKFEVGVAFCGEVVKASASVQAGVELTASTEIEIVGTTTAESKHACTLCISGECEWFAEGKVKLKICIVKDILEGTPIDWQIFKVSGPLNIGVTGVSPVGTIGSAPAKFYISIINSPDSVFKGHLHIGSGSCPNKSWRTVIKTKDGNGEAITGVAISINGTNNNTRITGSSEYAAYLYDGIYKITATINGVAVTKSIVVNGAAQEIVLTPSSASGKINGKICASETGSPVGNATILISQGNMVIGTLKSGNDGIYTLPLPDGTYRVEITKDGYIPFVEYVKVENGNTTYLETALLVSGSKQSMGGFSGTIRDAVTGNAVPGVSLKIREGWNNSSSGDVIKTLTTDSNGFFIYDTTTLFNVVFGLKCGNYTLTASKAGYTTSSFNVVVLPGIVKSNQDSTISPSAQEGEYRVVLSWGATPNDLDSHFNAVTTQSVRDHVYYSSKTGITSNLDRDDTDSYGPETITVTNFENLEDGFVYSIHDYTNRASTSSNALASSGAIVKLYCGNDLLKTYNVPTGMGGTVWNVFSIDKDGTIKDINTFEYIEAPENVGYNLLSTASLASEVVLQWVTEDCFEKN